MAVPRNVHLQRPTGRKVRKTSASHLLLDTDSLGDLSAHALFILPPLNDDLHALLVRPDYLHGRQDALKSVIFLRRISPPEISSPPHPEGGTTATTVMPKTTKCDANPLNRNSYGDGDASSRVSSMRRKPLFLLQRRRTTPNLPLHGLRYPHRTYIGMSTQNGSFVKETTRQLGLKRPARSTI